MTVAFVQRLQFTWSERATVVGSMAVNKTVSAPNRGPLELALAARDVEAVRVAISSGADVNQSFADGLTPLCRMAALGERRILKLLLNANANPDQQPPPRDEAQPVSDVASQVVSAGFSALHWACRENKMECVKLLLESKAIVDVRAADNVTPFMLACKNGYHELAKHLMVAGADIEAANVRGGTAMVVACVMGNAEILRTLLVMRAKADAVTVAIDDSEELFECRPLVTACRYNHPKCVSLLLAEALSAETLAIATKELEEFPSFTECAKLVRRAVERREQREQRFGVRPPAVPVASAVASADVDAVSATERADAAMAALIAEEMKPRTAAAPPKPSGKKKRPAAQHAKKAREADAAAAASMAMASLSSSLSSSSSAAAAAAAAVMPTAAELEMTVTTEETAATAEVAAAAATGAPGMEPAGSVAAEAATTPLRTPLPGTPRSPTSPPKPDMHALMMEYELYQYQTSETHQRRKSQEEAEEEEGTKPNQAKPSQAWLGLSLEEDDDDEEEEGEEEGALGKKHHDDKGEEGKENLSRSSNSDEDGPTAQNEEPAPLLNLGTPLVAAEAQTEYAQLDALLRRRLSARSADDAGNEMSQLNMYFSRKKFTTSAMSFFLTKFRESSLTRETVVPLTEDERRRRKARRPPPPPGCLSPDASATSHASRLAPPPPAAAAAAGAEPSLRPVSSSSSSNLMPNTAPIHRLARSASYAELERRLEQELEAARMREASLKTALKLRSEALSHLVLCPITHEPMVDPVSAADGQTYERRAIEAWIKKGTVPISPLTGEPLEDLTLRPNFLAKALTQERAGN